MALIPPIPWVMGVPCANHGLRTFELIPDIMRGVAGQPTHGIYPILRMPVYKTYAQHAANRTAINAEFAVCGCQGAIAAWARFNIAWATINGGPGPALIGGTKAFNDAFELGPANVPPVFAGLPGEPPLIHRTVGNWGPFFPPDTFDFVKSRTHQIWRKLNPISFYPKHMHNSFWHALSLAIWQDEKYWAQIKAGVARYAQEILTPPWGPGVHPRAVDYQNLNAYALVRAAAVGAAAPMYPVAHLHNQLARDGGLLGAVLGDRASSELWQIVADALRIELLVIIAQPLPTDPQKLIVPRGQHNAKQIFLYLEIDGEYRAVEPASRDPGSYRFEWFKDVEHNIPARTAAQALTWAVKIDLADEKRSPFTIVDTWERPIGVPPMPAGAAVPPAAILGAYAPPFVPPNPIVVDPISSVATDAQAFAYLNSGHWC